MNSNKFILFIIGAALLVPRIPLIPAGLGESVIRIDGVLSALAGAIIFLTYGRPVSFIMLLVVGSLYVGQNSSSLILSAAYFFQVLSIIMLPSLLNKMIAQNQWGEKDFERAKRILVYYSAINIIIAAACRGFGVEVCIDSSGVGCVGGYGLLDRPYIFSVYTGAAFVLLCSDKKIKLTWVVFLLFGLLISDSRAISAFMLTLGIAIYIRFNNITLRHIGNAAFISTAALLVFLLADGKMGAGYIGQAEIDPSWAMRLVNFENYFNWVDLKKLVVGNGAFAFYEFSVQYGVPGPVDNLYVRVASEIGVLGGLTISILLVRPLWRSAKYNQRKLIFSYFMISIAAAAVFQESLLAPKAGHVYVLLGIYLSSLKKYNLEKLTILGYKD